MEYVQRFGATLHSSCHVLGAEIESCITYRMLVVSLRVGARDFQNNRKGTPKTHPRRVRQGTQRCVLGPRPLPPIATIGQCPLRTVQLPPCPLIFSPPFYAHITLCTVPSTEFRSVSKSTPLVYSVTLRRCVPCPFCPRANDDLHHCCCCSAVAASSSLFYPCSPCGPERRRAFASQWPSRGGGGCGGGGGITFIFVFCLGGPASASTAATARAAAGALGQSS